MESTTTKPPCETRFTRGFTFTHYVPLTPIGPGWGTLRARGGHDMANRRATGKLRKLPSKKWQASYVGPNGVRYSGPTTYTR